MKGTAKREYMWWCEEDYALLFEAIAADMTEEQIAEHTERRVGAVQARAHMLVSYATSKARALDMLRRVASQPDFEWEPFVRTVHAQEGLPYWDTAADLALITGWGEIDPPRMRQLCEQIGADEDQIASRCILLKLAETRAEVVDRFGADEDGALYLNAMLSRDKVAVAVWVLVLVADDGQVLHISTHPTQAAAAGACHRWPTTGLAAVPARWTIAMRVCGEGSVRATESGLWDELPTISADTAVTAVSPSARSLRWWTRRFRRGADARW
ncbi:MAG: hypothetical protein H5T78_03150 [Nocardia sp.]|nr:hypothetical protein [Nocardia sp.]